MPSPSPPLEDPAERLLARFLEEKERGETDDFDGWLNAQEELRDDPELRDRVRALRDAWSEAASLLADAGARKLESTRFYVGGTGREEPDPTKDVAPGEEIGDFRLLRRIGRGGMGQVWEAEQKSLRRRVALKLVLPDRVDPAALELFAREARAGGRLHDEHIVRTLAYGTDRGLAWIAQELVEGSKTLKDFLDEMRAAEDVPADYYRSVADFAVKVTEGLAAAHDANVIHRDVKPQNILIGPDDEPKLTDFGLARIVDESGVSRTGDIAGTYYYMSPEQVAAKRRGIDHRTDVFSFGIVLYEMLTLRRPFEGDTSHQICAKIVTWDPPDPRKVRSQCPAELAVICGKCLEKTRDDRYATVTELGADLRRHLANEPILARPPGRLVKARKWAQRNPYKAIAGGVATVAFFTISLLLGLFDAKRVEAQTNLKEARIQEAIAKRRADDVLGLSAFQELEDLELWAEELWPPHPRHLKDYSEWLADAEKLVAGLDPDPASDDVGHRARLSALREKALPWTDADREAAERTHPRFRELPSIRSRLTALRSAQAVREGRSSVLEVELDSGDTNRTALDLIAEAQALVEPRRSRFGQEGRGLALARAAVERVEDDTTFVQANQVLAWALLANGLSAQAREEMELALDVAPESDRAAIEGATAALEAAIAAAEGKDGQAAVEAVESELDELESELASWREWSFETDEDRWWHSQLEKLIVQLEAFADTETGLWRGVSGAHGWGIARRKEFAETIETRSVTGSEVSARWKEARRRVATGGAYGDLDLVPQLGLVPIGPDPESGFEEFGHPLSGSVPQRNAEGELVVEDDMSLVFVLLPGGTFLMGAQTTDPSGSNYDPQAEEDEAPPHDVFLPPFFLSKFEMTQGQWKHFTGLNPSRYNLEDWWSEEGQTSSEELLLHPVERVNWFKARRILDRMQLSLPTEAQWEYAARAGTDTPWWTGERRESLHTKRAANLADKAARLAGATWPTIDDWIDDGYPMHAPVNTYTPNPFGLHGVHGNVWEWCADGYLYDFYQKSERTSPLRDAPIDQNRVTRGGGFVARARHARSSDREALAPDLEQDFLGLRPARSVAPRPAAQSPKSR